MDDYATALLAQIERDIDANRVILPSLPDVALRVRQLTSDLDCDIALLEKEVAKDAGITARLMKVANSSALRRGRPLTSLRLAISSLGFVLVRSFVTQLAILQTMQRGGDTERLRGFVAGSLRISALCHGIARPLPHLDAEHAALGGLLHDIGKLPLRDFLARRPELAAEEALEVEKALHPEVGAIMLRRWQMDENLIRVAREHERLLRDPPGGPDYVDVTIAANVLHYGTESGRYAHFGGIHIPALGKCGLHDRLHRPTPDVEQRMAFALAMIEN